MGQPLAAETENRLATDKERRKGGVGGQQEEGNS